MALFINNLKRRFVGSPLLMQLIYLNIGVLILVRLIAISLTLFNSEYVSFLQWIQLPANLSLLLTRPWTLVSYMFLQFDLLHLLFNMLWLYWFGKLFLSFFTPKQMGSLYFLGGIGGGLFFLFFYNLLPFFETVKENAFLMGSSAAVIAIVVATGFYAPNLRIRLLFLGEVALKYIALATILLDAISITSANAGGHIAHLGGAFVGFLFVHLLAKGNDITKPVSRCFDLFANWRERRSRNNLHTHKGGRSESDTAFNRRKMEEREAIGRILDKVKRTGYENLSAAEKKQLFDAGNRN